MILLYCPAVSTYNIVNTAGFADSLRFKVHLCSLKHSCTSVEKAHIGEAPNSLAYWVMKLIFDKRRESDILLEYEVVKCLKKILNKPVSHYTSFYNYRFSQF